MPIPTRSPRTRRSLATALVAFGLCATLPALADVRIDRVDPSPICLGRSFQIIGDFGAEPERYQVQIRPAAGGAPLLSRGRRQVSWNATRLTLDIAADAVAPATYRLTVDTFGESGFATLRNVRFVRCEQAELRVEEVRKLQSKSLKPLPQIEPGRTPAATGKATQKPLQLTHPELQQKTLKLPPGAPPIALKLPDLEIVRVEGIHAVRPAGPRGLSRGNGTYLDVVVHNKSAQEIPVRATYLWLPAERGRPLWHNTGFVSRRVTIAGGATETITLLFTVNDSWVLDQLVHGAETYVTEVFLVRADADEQTQTVDQARWTDATPSDNRMAIRIPIEPFPTWDIEIRMTRLAVRHRCDAVSAGDWVFFFDTCQGSSSCNGSSLDWTHRHFWPPKALDVNNGDVLVDPTSKSGLPAKTILQVPRSYSGSIHLDATAWDCDTGGENWTMCRNAEEFPEVGPGGHCDAGTAQLTLTSTQWHQGGEFDLGAPTILNKPHGNNCGDNAYSGRVRVRIYPQY